MSVYQRKSGRWAVRVDLDRGANGARARVALGTFRTKKEAERAEREAHSNRDRGIDLAPGTVTVEMLLDRYVRDRAAMGRGKKTIEEYRRVVNLYIRPRIGTLPLARLKPAHVAEWIATIFAH